MLAAPDRPALLGAPPSEALKPLDRKAFSMQGPGRCTGHTTSLQVVLRTDWVGERSVAFLQSVLFYTATWSGPPGTGTGRSHHRSQGERWVARQPFVAGRGLPS